MTRCTMKESMQGITIKEGTKPKLVEYSTFEYTRPDGAKVIRQHHTDIVIKTTEGKTILTSGGYKTKTTQDRLHTYSGYRVYQNKSVWYVAGEAGTIPFYDGMILPDAFKKKQNTKLEDKTKKTIKQIKDFVSLLDKMDKPPMPSAGYIPQYWHIEDIAQRDAENNDKEESDLTDKELREIAQNTADNSDANYGICWESFDAEIETVKERRNEK